MMIDPVTATTRNIKVKMGHVNPTSYSLTHHVPMSGISSREPMIHEEKVAMRR